MTRPIDILLAENERLRAALRSEVILVAAAFGAPYPHSDCPRETVQTVEGSPVTALEVAPVAWEQARAEVERVSGVRFLKFFR